MRSDAEQHLVRILQLVLDVDQEQHGVLAVDDAVVVADRHVHHRRGDDRPLTSDGALMMACMPRMALCGGLTIGVEKSEPKVPPLVMVKVPPSGPPA